MSGVDDTQRRLDEIQLRLDQATAELAALRAPPAEIDAERRADLLWKLFNEVSNYDRHYSTVRSALTILLVSVGLAAAGDPVKALFAIAAPHDDPFCLKLGWAAFVEHGLLPFGPMLLIFALAVVINIYFQRLTAACEILEDEIERRIIELSPGLGPPGPQNAKAAGVSGYRFRQDFRTIYRRTSNRHVDAMKALLFIGIGAFVLFIAVAGALPCVWAPSAPAATAAPAPAPPPASPAPPGPKPPPPKP